MSNDEISLNTEKKLSESLKRKMCAKAFSKISVSEIIEDCHINRSTFYYHFDGKPGLLKWTVEHDLCGMMEHMDFIADPEDSIRCILNYLDDNHWFLKSAYDSLGRDGLKCFFYADMKSVVASNMKNLEESSRLRISCAEKDYLSEFFIEGLAGMAFNYAEHVNHKKREDIIQHTSQLISHLRIFADE